MPEAPSASAPDSGSALAEKTAALKSMLQSCRAVLVLCGAGLTTESGIPDFRSESSIMRTIETYGECPEVILSEQFFYRNPERFFDYYRNNLLIEAEPNAGHFALSRLEKTGRLLSIVTQNVDDLLKKAGALRVLQLHGSVHENRCVDCGRYFPLSFVRDATGVPHCPDCGHIVKPGVTLYGENLDEAVLRAAKARMFSADMLLVVGTSLAVYPAADLPQFFMGKRIAIVNLTETPLDSRADLVIRARAAAVLDAAVQ